MKPKIASLALAVLIFATAHSQSIHLGIKGGTNINKITGKSFKDQFDYGYHLGGFAEVGLGSKWAFQPEVLFNQINTDTSSEFSKIYTGLTPNNVSKIKLKYLSIPLLLDYKATKFFTIQAGPQFGILLDQNKNLFQNGKEAFKKGDLSMLAGIQLKVGALRVYGRYAIGLNNINDIDNKDKWKNQSIQLGIGLAFL